MARPFSERKADALYFTFLIIHLVATVFVDFQGLYIAKSISPAPLRAIFLFGSEYDPLLSNCTSPGFEWFQSFLWLEVLLQLPLFIYGSYYLYKDDPPLILLTIYGTHASTTTFACLFTILMTPGLEAQLPQLLGSYVPFLVIPLIMTFDFGGRINHRLKSTEQQKKKD